MTALPSFVSAGEALTDFIRTGEHRWESRAGGAGWNVARAAAALGLRSAFAGAVSQDDLGEELARLSAEAGLDLRFLQRADRPPLLAMVPETHPPRYFFVGENSADLAFDPKQLPQGWLQAAEALHFGGISLTREPLASRLLGLAEEARALGRLISFDPNYRATMTAAYRPTLERMVRLADLIKVSDEDLSGLFPGQDEAEALSLLRGWNPVAVVVVTRGARGAELYHAGEVVRVSPPRIMVVDTVGAGDAFAAALVYSRLRRETDLTGHLAFAVAAGAAACTRPGAYPPALDDVAALL